MRGTVIARRDVTNTAPDFIASGDTWLGRYLRIGFFSFVSPTKKNKTWQAIARPCGLSSIAIDQWPGSCRCKSGPQHGWTKMIAARVTETYTSLFLTPKQDDGSRYSVVARIGAFEVRLLEVPSVNSPDELELWIELYDRDLRVGVDSCKCSDLDEAIDAAQFLAAQAREQSRGISAILLRAITSESIAA